MTDPARSRQMAQKQTLASGKSLHRTAYIMCTCGGRQFKQINPKIMILYDLYDFI